MSARSRSPGAAVATLLLSVSACHLFEPKASEAPPPAPSAEPSAPAGPMPVALPPLEDAGSAPPPPRDEPAPPGVVQGVGPTRGTLPKGVVAAEMERAFPAFHACYTRALAAKPELRGTLLVEFVVAPDGSVPYAAPNDAGTDLDDDAAIDCILDELSKRVFPQPTGGRVFVKYPLKFEPLPAR